MLITPEYAALNAELHQRVPTYGVGGHKWGRYVRAIARKTNAISVLDYGCGKGALGDNLRAHPDSSNFEILEYDPAILGKESVPGPADIVVCTDVLEHVEEDCVRWVLLDIVEHARKAVILSISTRVGRKTLADGRPAHILVRPKEWWEHLLIGYARFKEIPERDPTQYSAVARFE